MLVIDQSVAKGLNLVGDRWSLLILRDAFLGRTRFEEFRQSSGIGKSTLSRRLESLVEAGVLMREPCGIKGQRYQYGLTTKGWGLFDTALLAWHWEQEWTTVKTNIQASKLPAQLIHDTCGHPLYPKAVCAHCLEEIKLADITLPKELVDPTEQLAVITTLETERRRRTPAAVKPDTEPALTNISGIIGDRWTMLLLIAAFFGYRRYDDFVTQLGIATNILTQRLNLLTEQNVLARRAYQDRPVRFEYRLTNKGRSLYPIVMGLRDWVIRWFPGTDKVAQFQHALCGQPLEIAVLCRFCDQVPTREQVRLRQTA